MLNRSGTDTVEIAFAPRKAWEVVRVDRIFIVEQDAIVRDSLRVLLEAHQFKVCEHATPESMLTHLASHAGSEPSCLLLDIDKMDCIKFIQRLHAHGYRFPVIAMTGKNVGSVRRTAERAGAHSLLEKPWAGGQLLTAIQAALAHHHHTSD
jgi:FixJ family two-component response regulator